MNIRSIAKRKLPPSVVCFLKEAWRRWRLFYKWRNARLVKGPLTYNADGLATLHNAECLVAPRFRDAYDVASRVTGNTHNLLWRRYLAAWAAEQASRLDGDFVDSGVDRGLNAHTIIRYLDFARLGKTYYLCDTFSGWVPELFSEAERQGGKVGPGRYGDTYEEVKSSFSAYPFVSLVRGAVPDSLSQVTAEKIAFLCLDTNCLAAEIGALEYFWDKIVPGGIVLIDTYTFHSVKLIKTAIDDFLRERGVTALSLPTGQGLVIHP